MKRPLFSRPLHWIWNLANFMQLVNQHKLQTSNKCPRESGTNQRQPEPFPQHHQHAASSSCSINIMIEENWPMPEIPTPLGRLWSAILESTITSAFQGIRNATEACFFPLYWRIPLVVVFPPLTNQVLVFFCSDQVDLWPIIFPFHTCQLSFPVRLTLKVTKSSETHIISSNRILEVSSFFLLRVLLFLLLRQIIGWAPLDGQGVTSENRSCIKCQCFRIK